MLFDALLDKYFSEYAEPQLRERTVYDYKKPVSYTHLDVYKRQVIMSSSAGLATDRRTMLGKWRCRSPLLCLYYIMLNLSLIHILVYPGDTKGSDSSEGGGEENETQSTEKDQTGDTTGGENTGAGSSDPESKDSESGTTGSESGTTGSDGTTRCV